MTKIDDDVEISFNPNMDLDSDPFEYPVMDGEDEDLVCDDSFVSVIAFAGSKYQHNLLKALWYWHTTGLIEGHTYDEARESAIHLLSSRIIDCGGSSSIPIGSGIFITMDFELDVMADSVSSFKMTFYLTYMRCQLPISYVEVSKNDRVHFSIGEADVSFIYPGFYEKWCKLLEAIGDDRKI